MSSVRAYLAVLGSVAGAWLNYWLLTRIGATRLVVMGLVEPFVAVLLRAAFLGESLNAGPWPAASVS